MEEGSAVSLTATPGDPGAVDAAFAFTYDWSIKRNGDLYAVGSGPDSTFSFTRDDDGSYEVSVRGFGFMPLTLGCDEDDREPLAVDWDHAEAERSAAAFLQRIAAA